jgi:hypothetical protein
MFMKRVEFQYKEYAQIALATDPLTMFESLFTPNLEARLKDVGSPWAVGHGKPFLGRRQFSGL